MHPLISRVAAATLVAVGLIGAFAGVLPSQATDADDTSADPGPERTGQRLPADADVVIDTSATAMGEVTSVRFAVERTGAPVAIDPLGSIELDAVTGRFSAPADAEAIVAVTIDGNLATELGAVALGSEIWLSNPITGEFEPLPPSYDIDPSRFFDPTGGWRPLLAGLTERSLISADDDAYIVRGTAPSAELRRVTAGIVEADDVVVDLWIDPSTALVDRIEFSVTDTGGATSQWRIDLGDYGAPFVITAPDGVSA